MASGRSPLAIRQGQRTVHLKVGVEGSSPGQPSHAAGPLIWGTFGAWYLCVPVAFCPSGHVPPRTSDLADPPFGRPRWMPSAGLLGRALLAAWLARVERLPPAAPPPPGCTCDCACHCAAPSGTEALWAYAAGILTGVLGCVVAAVAARIALPPAGPEGPRRQRRSRRAPGSPEPSSPLAPLRYRPRHASGPALEGAGAGRPP